MQIDASAVIGLADILAEDAVQGELLEHHVRHAEADGLRVVGHHIAVLAHLAAHQPADVLAGHRVHRGVLQASRHASVRQDAVGHLADHALADDASAHGHQAVLGLLGHLTGLVVPETQRLLQRGRQAVAAPAADTMRDVRRLVHQHELVRDALAAGRAVADTHLGTDTRTAVAVPGVRISHLRQPQAAEGVHHGVLDGLHAGGLLVAGARHHRVGHHGHRGVGAAKLLQAGAHGVRHRLPGLQALVDGPSGRLLYLRSVEGHQLAGALRYLSDHVSSPFAD